MLGKTPKKLKLGTCITLGMALEEVYATKRFELLYTPEEQTHFDRSKCVNKFLSRKAAACVGSANTYATTLRAFGQYILRERGAEIDDYIEQLRQGMENPYDCLAGFVTFLQEREGRLKIGVNVLNGMVKTAKRFLRFSGVPVTNEDFREQVSMPRRQRVPKKGIGKKDVIRLLNAADLQLKVFCMFLAVTGCRPAEACAVRNKDIDLYAEPPTVSFRAEYSKMRVGRTRYITRELAEALRVWGYRRWQIETL